MRKLALFTLGVIMCFSISCQNNPHTKQGEQRLRVNISGEPATLDPRKGGDPISSSLQFLLFEGLTRLDQDGSTSLAAAESLTISEDRKTYTFHLKDCCWNNGKKVKAEDFEKSWKDILDPQFPSVNGHLLYPIKNAEAAKKGQVPLDQIGVKAIDSQTLLVELAYPTPYFLGLISFCALYPMNHEIDQKNSLWAQEARPDFVCNGPYQLKEWKHNHYMILEKNPRYWDADSIKIDTIHVSMIDNEITALSIYESGGLDILGQPLSSIPLDILPGLAEKNLLNIMPIGGTTCCFFNNDKFPFTNANIRKAFSLAINREEITKNITCLNELVATNMIPPVLNGGKSSQFFPDNEAVLAREYLQKGLAELGVRASDLDDIIYHYKNAEMDHKVAQAIQQQWKRTLGINVAIEAAEYKVLMDKLNKKNYLFGQFPWIAQYSDPMNIFERFKFKTNVKNYSGWEDPHYIELVDRSNLATTDSQRLILLEEAEALLLDQMPFAPIFHWNTFVLAQPYVENVGFSPIGNILFRNLCIKKHDPS